MTTNTSPLDPLDVAAHAESVRALARRLVKDGGAAEDVAQEAWLVAMRRPRRDDVPLGWWLRGVVKNVVRHARRDEATRRRHEQAAPPARDADAPDALVERTETHHRLVGAVLALEEPYRATILMRYFEGLDAAEIARRIDAPAATVRSRLKRGLDMLRARLDADADGDRRKWALVVAPFAWTGESPRPTNWFAPVAACLLLGAVAAVAVLRPWRADAAGDVGGRGDDAAVAAKPTIAADDAAPRARRPRSDATDVVEAATPTAAPPIPDDVPDVTPSDRVGFSIEVVDESGKRVSAQGVTIEFDHLCAVRAGREISLESFELLGGLSERSAGRNPFVVRDLPAVADGKPFDVYARVPGFPPTATASFVARLGKTTSVTLVATKPRTASVVVVDRSTDRPVAGASVASSSELAKRDVSVESVRGKTAPGAAVTDEEGRCELGGLGAGAHDVEVDAPGYRHFDGTWTDGECRVRLEPLTGAATLIVNVLGKDGTPLSGVGVSLFRRDGIVQTDAAGRAVFVDVPPGSCSIHVEFRGWSQACRERRWDPTESATLMAHFPIAAGETRECALGFPRTTAALAARVVDAAGAPVAGVAAQIMSSSGVSDAVTDADGALRFEGLPAGDYYAFLRFPPTRWYVDRGTIVEGRVVARTWVVGTHVLRGRVVTGPDRRPAADVGVRAILSANLAGSTKTDAEGRFEIPRAVAATYTLSVLEDAVGARRPGVVVPYDGEIVLELVAFGRVSVRFLESDRPQLRAAKVRVFHHDEEGDFIMKSGVGEDDFVAPNLLPGRYEVEVSLDGRKKTFPVEVTSGETSVVVVTAP